MRNSADAGGVTSPSLVPTLLAAEAILKGDRKDFDTRADPARPLGIASTWATSP